MLLTVIDRTNPKKIRSLNDGEERTEARVMPSTVIKRKFKKKTVCSLTGKKMETCVMAVTVIGYMA